MEMKVLGQMLILFGIMIVIIGIVLIFGGKIPFLGRLPGDITLSGRKWTFHFPIVTSLVISLILTLVLNLFLRR